MRFSSWNLWIIAIVFLLLACEKSTEKPIQLAPPGAPPGSHPDLVSVEYVQEIKYWDNQVTNPPITRFLPQKFKVETRFKRAGDGKGYVLEVRIRHEMGYSYQIATQDGNQILYWWELIRYEGWQEESPMVVTQDLIRTHELDNDKIEKTPFVSRSMNERKLYLFIVNARTQVSLKEKTIEAEAILARIIVDFRNLSEELLPD